MPDNQKQLTKMKSYNVYAVLILLLLPLALLSCNGCDNEGDKPKAKAAPPCSKPDFSTHTRELNDLNIRKPNFSSNYKIVKADGTESPMDPSTARIAESFTVQAIDDLKQAISVSGNNRVGLKIYYGVTDTEDNMFLIYKPVELAWVDTIDGWWRFNINENSSSKYHLANASADTVQVDRSDISSNITLYQEKMKHKVGTEFHALNISDADPTSDPRSVIFPIDEIQELIAHNNTTIPAFIDSVKKYYKTEEFEAMEFMQTPSVTGVKFHSVETSPAEGRKHSIYIEPLFTVPGNPSLVLFSIFDEIDPQDTSLLNIVNTYFKGKLADLGSLCPPNCPTISHPCE